MDDSNTPEPVRAPDTDSHATRRLVVSAGVGAAVAVAALLLFILPAEYGVDPTGVGGALGLTAMNEPAGPTRTIEITDVIGGNETVREVQIPAFGEPIPLPNTDIHQDQAEAYRTDKLTVTIGPDGGETEIKTVLKTSKVILYSWSVDRGSIYSDFHGHDPELGNEFWVRYKEHQEGSGHNGSLVAPFNGEHGWYWLNYNEFPVTVTLEVAGYYDDIIDYSDLF